MADLLSGKGAGKVVLQSDASGLVALNQKLGFVIKATSSQGSIHGSIALTVKPAGGGAAIVSDTFAGELCSAGKTLSWKVLVFPTSYPSNEIVPSYVNDVHYKNEIKLVAGSYIIEAQFNGAADLNCKIEVMPAHGQTDYGQGSEIVGRGGGEVKGSIQITVA